MKKAMKQSTISTLLGSISMALLVITAILVVASSIISRKAVTAVVEKNELITYANQLKNASVYLTTEVRAYAATGKRLYFDNYWNEVNTLKNRDAAIAKMNEIGLTEKEKSLISTIGSTSNNLIPIEEAAMKQVELRNNANATRLLYDEEYMKGITAVQSYTRQFMEELDQRTTAAVNMRSDRSFFASLVAQVFLALMVLVQIYYLSFMRKKVISPIIKVQHEMEQISQGNLSSQFNMPDDTSEIGMLAASIHRTKKFLTLMIGDISMSLEKMAQGKFNFTVDHDYIGEFGVIKRSLQQILKDLNQIIGGIKQGSEQVSSASEQVAGTSQVLSQGATEQASEVERLLAVVESINEQIKQDAVNAENGSKSAAEVGTSVLTSTGEMEKMLTAIDEIHQTSTKISGIIKTIDDIAFQTNILALNAAVEAARAGAAGKGFAVVADEVRNLASKSAGAAKDTTALIESVIKAVDNGLWLASNASESLVQVKTGTKVINDVVENISKSTIGQASSIAAVKEGVVSIAHVIQSNAATAQEEAATAEELSSQAEMMRELVGKLQLSDANQAEFAVY